MYLIPKIGDIVKIKDMYGNGRTHINWKNSHPPGEGLIEVIDPTITIREQQNTLYRSFVGKAVGDTSKDKSWNGKNIWFYNYSEILEIVSTKTYTRIKGKKIEKKEE